MAAAKPQLHVVWLLCLYARNLLIVCLANRSSQRTVMCDGAWIHR